MGTETASVLFTDVVGSTELRVRLGEESADVLRRVHDDLVGNVISGTGGRVVKGLGDGAMAVFGSAGDAVAAAIGIQQAVDRNGRGDPDAAFDLRIGVSVGDVLFEEGDCHGTAVVEAARLCAAAQAGQVLVADLVRALARGRGGFVFESVGELELKGLDAPLSACFVAWEPAPPSRAPEAPPPFPRLLAPQTPTPYAGRAGLLADIGRAWDLVDEGAGSRVVLLAGEPGIGKTRTAAEGARRAHDEGAVVLYGRCDETLALPYEPFVEALDWQTEYTPQLPLGRFPGDLRRLLPDLERRVGGLPPAIRSDARAEEHRLFEATASWLAAASAPGGLLLVMDDLHWATAPTLQLMLHCARAAAADPDARLLVLATYRDTEVARDHPLFDLMGELRRLPDVERLSVDPLSESDVLELLTEVAGHELDDAALRLARRTYAETEGNPFFVGEVMRHFIESGVVRFEGGHWVVEDSEVVDVPEGVRDVVGRRLNRLSHAASEVLTAAAVIGRDFDVGLLAALTDHTEDALVDVLDECLRARLIEEVDADRLRFSHALTRRALYDELSAVRRHRWHRQVVAALESLRPDDVASLAHHAVEAGPVGRDLSAAIRYSLAAGERALAARAVADAVDHLTRALDMLDDGPDPHLDLRVRFVLGCAQRDGGDPAHRDTLLAVVADALEGGSVDIAVKAAIANSRVMPSVVGAVDEERVRAVEAVLQALDEEASIAERALLMATLSAELVFANGSLDRRLGLADRAVELAEACGDDWLLARVLVATSFALLVPERLDVAEDTARRAVRAADEVEDPTLRVVARMALGWTLQIAGQVETMRAVANRAAEIAEQEGNPTVRWMATAWRVQDLAHQGDLAGARALADRALELGQQAGEPDSMLWWGAHVSFLAAWEGALPDVAEFLGSFADQYPGAPVWRGAQAYALASGGRVDEARRLLVDHGLRDPVTVPRDVFTLHAWYVLALAAWQLDDAQLGCRLGQLLAPHRGRWSGAGTWMGAPVATGLAVALCAAGDLDGAVDAAIEGWEAVTTVEVREERPFSAALMSGVMASRGRQEDLVRARDIAEGGIAEARAMGMDRLLARLEGLRNALPAS